MKKRILILTASFGEGHNSAARGIRDGLARVAPEGTELELRDLFAEAYGPINELVRKSYLAVVNFAPGAWGAVYRWLDGKKDFDAEFARFSRIEDYLAALLERFQPDVMICTFPAYPNVLRRIQERNSDCSLACKIVVVVTDSITINAVWYRCAADYFLVANEQSASVLRTAGVAAEKIKVFGFPVSPKFADFRGSNRVLPSNDSERRVLYMIHAATHGAPDLVRRLAELGVDLKLIGFLNQTELGEAYALADCLVLPSDYPETWGLVVNEALAILPHQDRGLQTDLQDALGDRLRLLGVERGAPLRRHIDVRDRECFALHHGRRPACCIRLLTAAGP